MALSSDDIQDLKQFISTELSRQLILQLGDVRGDIKQLKDDIDARFEENDEKLNEILNAVGADLAKHTAKLDDHDERLVRLEKRAA